MDNAVFMHKDLQRLLKLVFEKRYLFIVISLIIMSTIVWGSYFIPKKYEAKSVIFIEQNVIEELVRGIAITPSMDARIRVLREIMLGRSLILTVLRKLDLDSNAVDAAGIEKMIISFRARTSISIRNSLISVSFKDTNPIQAKNYINTIVNEYLEKNIFAKRQEAYDATVFLEKQVSFFNEKIDKSEEKVIKFRQDQGIYITVNENSVIGEIKAYEEEIRGLGIRESELLASKSSSEKQLGKEDPYMLTIFNANDVKRTIESHESRLRQLLIKYTENYPEVIKIKAEIESLKKQQVEQPDESLVPQSNSEFHSTNPIYLELKQKIIEIESSIVSLHAKRKYLNGLIEEQKEQLRHIPENRKKLADLEKERDSFKSVYEQLLVRLGQSEVSKQMEIEDKTTTFRIIEPAILPRMPVSPNRVVLILAGIACGFLGGLGIIFLLDYLDDSVKTLDNLKTLGLPVFAVIPRISISDDLIKRKKKDVLIFGVAGVYIICILGVLAMEFSGLTYVEDFIANVFINTST